MRNLQSGLQEYRVNAVEGNFSRVDPNQKRRQNATQVCNYCCTNGQISSWCCKKLRAQDLKTREKLWKESYSLRLKITRKSKNPAMDQKNGKEVKVLKEETRTTLTMDIWQNPQQIIRIPLPDQTPHTGTTIRTMQDDMINAQINHSIFQEKR